jgi:glycosyltransferase involved in cell wall biosynthesis
MAFVLPSRWEEMGFVIIEAASCNTTIISSNCPNGPSEFLNYGEAGYLFENNSKDDLVKKINYFLNDNDKSINQKKINAKRNTKNFTVFNHFKQLETILSG